MTESNDNTDFIVDAKLARDSHEAGVLPLCSLRLIDDRRFPWVILVPRQPNLVEIHDLTAEDQTRLAHETAAVARALAAITGCAKINTGSLGNRVRQLHVHVVARFEDDSAWPGPVWGAGTAEPYAPADAERLIALLMKELSA